MRNALVNRSREKAGLPSPQPATGQPQLDSSAAPLKLRQRTQSKPTDIHQRSEDEGSNARALFNALHAQSRKTDAQAWRADLEAVFNVDAFLVWLCAGAVVGQWHTDDDAPCNMYIYTDPATREPAWISWHHNACFPLGDDIAVPLDQLIGGKSWPLVPYLLSDPVYFACYFTELTRKQHNLCQPKSLAAQVRAYLEMLVPGLTAQLSAAHFEATVAGVATRLRGGHANLTAAWPSC